MSSPPIPRACFAPPLSDAKLAEYRTLIESAPVDAETKDGLRTCLRCVEAWWDLPESRRADGKRWKTLHKGREITLQEVPLTDDLVQALDAVTPFMSELERFSPTKGPDMGKGLFDLLTGPLRDAAFHLLWYCREITLDREPMTADKL